MIRRREFLLNSGLATGSLLAVGKAASADSRSSVSWRTQVAEWEKRFPQLMTEFMVPGLSMAVINDARIVWRRGFGVKDAASKAPVTNDTMFEAGSMSKSVFT